MATFPWSNRFLTGLAMVDEHHRRLVELTNQIGTLLERPEAPEAGDLQAAFLELEAYAGYHFKAEEALMDSAGVDPRHAEGHRAEHRGFLDDVLRLKAEAGPTRPEKAQELSAFLTHWLVYHILSTDKALAHQIEAIRAGKTPGQAFGRGAVLGADVADLLLEAMQGLQRTLTRRNRELTDLNAFLDHKVEARTRELQDANRALVQVVGDLEATRDELRASSARYHAAMDTSLDGFWVLDEQGRFLEVNDRYCQLSGYTRDELLGMTIPDLEAQETPEQTARHIEKVLATGSELFETLHRARDGRIWPVEILATFWPEQGHRFFVFLRDISPRRKAEQDLRESERRFRMLFYDAPVGHALNRMTDGWFLAVNETFAALTGCTMDELNALSYWDLTPRAYADQEALQLASLQTRGFYGPYEKEYIRKDGRRIPVLLNGSRVTDPDGTELILSVVSDISERRKIEQERESLIQSLQEALEEVHSLSGMLPICSSCKKIRNDGGYWQQIEAYIAEHSEASFSHGICPDCAAAYFPGMGKNRKPD